MSITKMKQNNTVLVSMTDFNSSKSDWCNEEESKEFPNVHRI